jgi:hypothetical protein
MHTSGGLFNWRMLLVGLGFWLFWSPALLAQGVSDTSRPQQTFPLHQVNQRRVNQHRAAQAGIRKLSGRHLTLYTDVPSSPAVDQLPTVFDAAVPLWAAYFQIDPKKLLDWHVQAYLIADRESFARLHLLPEANLQFENGFSQGHELWCMEQPSDYYRRHLLLHEGTHAFMWTQLGGCGAPWYMEGMAELCATHRWDGQKLWLRHMPANREEAPMWGRIRLIQDAFAQHQAPSLDAVLRLGQHRRLSTDQYAWCWALVKLLDTNARFQQTFRRLPAVAARSDFQQHFGQQFKLLGEELDLQWRSLVSTLEFGHDFARMAIEPVPVRQVPIQLQGSQGTTCSIFAKRGWQSTGWLLRLGQTYRLTAKGRFLIAQPPGELWYCEPGGITIQYHAGKPLGKLLAALVPLNRMAKSEPIASLKASPGSPKVEAPSPMGFEPLAVGLGDTVTPHRDVVLYLRVNESSAQLADNRGSIEVSIETMSE